MKVCVSVAGMGERLFGDVRWSGGRDAEREERNQWFGQLEGLLAAWFRRDIILRRKLKAR
jgi:hypothetical protein